MLNEHVAGQFMDRAQAAVEFAKMRNRLPPTKSLPMNKQKGEKRHPAYLASMVAMTAESVFGPDGFVDDARKLSILTWEDPHATWAKCVTFSFYRRSFYVVGLWEVISLPND